MGRRRMVNGWWLGSVLLAAVPAARAQEPGGCLPCQQRLELGSAPRSLSAPGWVGELRLRWVGPTGPLDRMLGRVWVTIHLDQRLWDHAHTFGDRLDLGSVVPDRAGVESVMGGVELPRVSTGSTGGMGTLGGSSSPGINLPSFGGSSSGSSFRF